MLRILLAHPRLPRQPDKRLLEVRAGGNRRLVAVTPTHPFARLKSVPLRQIAAEPLIVLSRKDYPVYHRNLERIFATSYYVFNGKPLSLTLGDESFWGFAVE